MEPDLKKPLVVRDLSHLIPVLDRWSSQGIQNFIESGIPRDISQAVVNKGKSVIDFSERIGMISCPKNYGDVSLSQMRKLLDLMPANRHHWGQAVSAFNFWSMSSGWWEENKPNWSVRDEWRVEMGIERVNPIIKGKNYKGKVVDFLFRRMGHNSQLGSPETGYRYAKPEEISFSKVVEDLPVVTWKAGFQSFVVVSKYYHQLTTIVRAGEYFHDNVFYLVQTKV